LCFDFLNLKKRSGISMKVAIVRATIAREKLMADDFIPDSEEIIGYEEVDEEKFYRP
jgi:hypothetical protein